MALAQEPVEHLAFSSRVQVMLIIDISHEFEHKRVRIQPTISHTCVAFYSLFMHSPARSNPYTLYVDIQTEQAQ